MILTRMQLLEINDCLLYLIKDFSTPKCSISICCCIWKK